LREKTRTVTLSKFVQDFLSFARTSYAPATVEIYERSLAGLMDLAPGLTLREITAQHLDRYKMRRLGEVSPVSVNMELRSLRAAMNVAVSWKFIETNPFLKLKQARVPESQPSYLTKQDFQRLIDQVKEPWLKEIIVFAVLTGMRRGEILNLRWEDVDLPRKVIRIHSRADFKTKQGRQRVVPMSEGVYHLLSARYARTMSEYVFTLNARKVMEDWVSRKFKTCVRKAGLENTKLHFHSLRHTFASWLVQDGVSLYEVQKLLGHSSIAVTQVYSHLQPEQLHDTVNRLKIGLN
jgi:integrase